VHLEASIKPPIFNLIHEFLTNMAFTMACPNFKKGLKMAFGSLGDKKPLVLVNHFSNTHYKRRSNGFTTIVLQGLRIQK
jgi:hypothetical protein